MKTGWTVLLVLGVVGVWDVILATNAARGDTISEVTLAFTQRHPWLTFALGYVAGHLTWPQYREKKEVPKA